MSKVLDYYENLGLKEIVIYNFHNSSSNSYYHKFGAEVLRTEHQMEEQLPTDVFRCDIVTMKEYMNKSMVNKSFDD
jgi:hypothetical protein